MKLSSIGIFEAIERPKADLESLAHKARFETPSQLATRKTRDERRKFIADSIGDQNEAETFYERVIGGNELQPISYLERGVVAAMSVGVIAQRGAPPQAFGLGTGFLIAPGILITNHHVLRDAAEAAASSVKFRFEADLADNSLAPIVFDLQPERLFLSSPEDEQDFTVVAVALKSNEGNFDVASFGQLPLLDVKGKAAEGEWLTLIQHPDGGPKKFCVRENQLLKRGEEVLWYSSDTLPGSSGSPVFNNDWYVVALHHSSIPQKKNGTIQTIDGRDYDGNAMADDNIRWIANEGIRASRIAQTLKRDMPDSPLLRPMYEATPASARIAGRPVIASAEPQPRLETSKMSATQIVTVPVEIRLNKETGEASVVAGSVATTSMERASGTSAGSTGRNEQMEARFDSPFDEDYDSRKGYDEAFLGVGESTVPLPKLGALASQAAPLLKPATGSTGPVLRYHNYSLEQFP